MLNLCFKAKIIFVFIDTEWIFHQVYLKWGKLKRVICNTDKGIRLFWDYLNDCSAILDWQKAAKLNSFWSCMPTQDGSKRTKVLIRGQNFASVYHNNVLLSLHSKSMVHAIDWDLSVVGDPKNGFWNSILKRCTFPISCFDAMLFDLRSQNPSQKRKFSGPFCCEIGHTRT